MLSVRTENESETLAWAQTFARLLSPGDVVALSGDLGSGKTTLSKGICRALGFEGPVNSPSYALMHEYPGPIPIFHLDLYRLSPGADFHEIGIEHSAFSHGIALIEWPERLGNLDIGITWTVTLRHLGGNTREIVARKTAP